MKKKYVACITSLLLQIALVLLLTSVTVSAGAVTTQTFSLHPGWNAIFLEVQPEPADMATAFGGVSSLASVWTWNPRGLSTQVIQNPGQLVRRDSDWRVYLPASRGEDAFINNLFALQANRAYLIEITGSSNVTWTVAGAPVLKRREWIANSFNLTGFPVQASNPPTFGSFFADSKAHKGQAVYRLTDSGIWEFVQEPSAVAMRPGEAFWIYTEAASNYTGPLSALPESGYDLNFYKTVPERTFKVSNKSSVTRSITVSLKNADAAFPLMKCTLDDNGKDKWVLFGQGEAFSLSPGEEKLLRFAVERAHMSTVKVSAMLEVSDSTGVLYRVPVSAEKGGL